MNRRVRYVLACVVTVATLLALVSFVLGIVVAAVTLA